MAKHNLNLDTALDDIEKMAKFYAERADRASTLDELLGEMKISGSDFVRNAMLYEKSHLRELSNALYRVVRLERTRRAMMAEGGVG
jgi:hypothetical protein